MTIQQILTLKRNAFRQHCDRWDRIRKAAYPETGGVGLYIHNWYACSRLPESNLASIIANTGQWDTWYRIEARIDRWFDRAEHRRHQTPTYIWCDFCQSAK